MNQIRISRKPVTTAACALRIARPAGPGSRAGARRGRGRRRVCLFGVVAVLLAAVGGPGLWQSVALASSSSVPNWTKQAPATSPSARVGASMAYDAATGTMILFGGKLPGNGQVYNGTWIWDGTTWTRQFPTTSPPARFGASMAYDAATGTVVLFGGLSSSGRAFGDTWTWNGTTWAKQAPATSPPARDAASMAYDAATGTVVLFGGLSSSDRALGDTWTWNGTTWAKQAPATSPPARGAASMAYDAATGTVVLFGGFGRAQYLGDTWTWDGTTWTKRAPATSPPAREGASIAYDAATSTVVLFGGDNGFIPVVYNGTWIWDGTTWTRQFPTTSPAARLGASMAYDAATSNVVLFGGEPATGPAFGDTWTWGSG